MDIIVKLPLAKFEGQLYDSFMTVTHKLCKIVTLILERETWTTEQWATAFLSPRLLQELGHPQSNHIRSRKSLYVSILDLFIQNAMHQTSCHYRISSTDRRSIRKNQPNSRSRSLSPRRLTSTQLAYIPIRNTIYDK